MINPIASKLVDEYINSSPEFARPICNKLRSIILKTDPNIVEDWKWGPNYNKKGMICGFGSFKKHVTLVFFKGALLKDQDNFIKEGKKNLNTRSMKFSNADEVNENLISRYIREAVKINEKGITAKNKTIEIPADLRSALKQNNILDKFEATNYTNRKEFILWIEAAKKQKLGQPEY